MEEAENLSWVFMQMAGMDKRTTFPPPHCIFPEPGQQRQNHSPVSLDLVSSPQGFACTVTAGSGKRKIQPNSPTCSHPYTTSLM